MDEYFTELNKVSKMSTADLIKYEEESGYYSLRRKCEEVYMRANPENFNSKEDLISFIKNNSDYIELVTDSENETSLEVKYQYNFDRYFANEDGLFRISNTLCKVIGDITCYTDINNLDKIKMINANNYKNYLNDTSISFSSNPNEKWGSTLIEKNSTNGGERTKIILIFDCTGYIVGPYMDFGVPVIRTQFVVRPYNRVLGIWYWCTRTISAEYDGKIVYQHHNNYGGYKLSNSISGFQNSIWSDINYFFMLDSNGDPISGDWQSHFMEYMYFEGDTPNTAPAIIDIDSPNDY